MRSTSSDSSKRTSGQPWLRRNDELRVPRLFALDHNFPDPIVAVLADFQEDAKLVRVDQIDSRMPDLEDWELLLALSLHA